MSFYNCMVKKNVTDADGEEGRDAVAVDVLVIVLGARGVAAANSEPAAASYMFDQQNTMKLENANHRSEYPILKLSVMETICSWRFYLMISI